MSLNCLAKGTLSLPINSMRFSNLLPLSSCKRPISCRHTRTPILPHLVVNEQRHPELAINVDRRRSVFFISYFLYKCGFPYIRLDMTVILWDSYRRAQDVPSFALEYQSFRLDGQGKMSSSLRGFRRDHTLTCPESGIGASGLKVKPTTDFCRLVATRYQALWVCNV